MSWFRDYCGVLVLLCVGLVGCGSLPGDVERVESYAFVDTEGTGLGRQIGAGVEEHPNLTGVSLLSDDYEAFETRLLLADGAERSLDIQTFLWRPDTAGRLLSKRLLEAADRGVRVRLLLDDYHVKDADFGLAAFDAHVNIELRIFNPFGTRMHFGRNMEMITNLNRLNHRMHNKLFIADNQLAIVGGRNVGDEYYDLNAKYNFVDLDVLIGGEGVGEVSGSFDEYWNSSWAWPIGAFEERPGEDEVKALRVWLDEWVDDRGEELGLPETRGADLKKLVEGFAWVGVDVAFEDPDKAHGLVDGVEGVEGVEVLSVGPMLRDLVLNSQSEILLASPYVVVGKAGTPTLDEALDRGVRVRVLTNSMAAADQMTAFSGYLKSRRGLLRSGVELYELKPGVGEQLNEATEDKVGDVGGLHAKVAVFDRQIVYIGSFNFDPRSANINTEVGLIIHDPKIAGEVAEFVERLMHPEDSWQSSLNEKGRLVWEGVEEGYVRRYGRDPGAPWDRHFWSFLFSLLPIEEQL